MTLALRTAVKHNAPGPKTADARHFEQNIETADFAAPVLFAGVYEYDASELGFDGGGRIRVYYPPEELAKKDFVQSVFYSALSVGTHEKNTREENANPDGWIREVKYDPKLKGVFATGVIYGKQNVGYVATNEKADKFGTSAFFRATYTPQQGTTPAGDAYDFIGSDLVCNHLAILANPRDDKNVVVITKINKAVAQHAKRAVSINKIQHDTGGIITMADENKGADKEAIRNALDEIKKEDEAKNEMSDLRNSLKNAQDEIAGLKNQLSKMSEPEKKDGDAANAEDDKKDGEAANAAHGLPAQEIVKTFAKHYGRDFGRVTPTFATLAEIADIKAETLGEKARAVVAHAKKLESATDAEAQHSESQGVTFAGFSAAI